MSKKKWTAVDNYLHSTLVPSDPALDAALETMQRAGLPQIQVTASQGKLLHLLARLQGAKKVLEIGTLGGYSTIWLARALRPGGKLITIEADPKHARVATENIARAGLSAKVEVRQGKALAILPELTGPFDLIFIDADKRNNPRYFEWALKLSRKGSLIFVDNVIREGEILDTNSTDPDLRGTRKLFQKMATDPRVIATAQQTVGSKGHDGFAMALVIA
ncbi:O-methyltransferase [Pseudacidobacterium ailaaui]|jgi:predicted O-methyltransferase YrrM|uniref:O-methyltransferase n=1 Tax=Pseudacidobacterium ailaaui TaxID=1382359 RepID=UPI00047E013F|nr:O-methyltransferase [Pseudacidobacterium ailaaui]MBX6360387.1 O-methyltransferase [Pseudacidobacterium ailaaui]MCL6463364.1 O-methyltransferase [Pseudacidobacterium ailaaui]